MMNASYDNPESLLAAEDSRRLELIQRWICRLVRLVLCLVGLHRWSRTHYQISMFTSRADYRTHVCLNALWGTEYLAYIGIGEHGGMLLAKRRCVGCRRFQSLPLQYQWEDACKLSTMRFLDAWSQSEFARWCPWWKSCRS